MDKREFSMLAMAMRTYYPKENILPNQQAMELWFNQLQDIPYNIAELALNKWVATNKWSPTIADIRESMADVSEGEIDDWGKGWEQVLMAVRKFGMYRVEEAMESLDDLPREAVKRLGFKEICLSENINQDRANFRMIYEQLAERKKKDAQIPLQVRQAIGAIQGNMMLEAKGGDE